MDARDALRLTGANIRSHKLRSLLAAIGVMLGVASVIGVVTLGAGFQELVTGVISSQVDSTTIIVTSQPIGGADGPPGAFASTNPIFTDRDIAAFAALPHITNVSAASLVPGAEVRWANQLVGGIVVTATTGARAVALDEGRHIAAEGEATVSNTTATRIATLAQSASALGLTLFVSTPTTSGNVTIVGVETATQFGPQVIESVTVASALLPTTMVNGTATRAWISVTLHATNAESVGLAKTEVTNYAATRSDARYRLSSNQEFSYQTQEDLAKTITTNINQFTAFIGAIGAIALLVGMVGIANIMLVSVQERTREIGVMKAIGAKRGEIMALFLLDAVAICLVGAGLGVVLGTFMGIGLGAFISAASGGDASVPFVFVADWYAIAILMGVVVGVVSGLYPAWRAASVSPVEALRYE